MEVETGLQESGVGWGKGRPGTIDGPGQDLTHPSEQSLPEVEQELDPRRQR